MWAESNCSLEKYQVVFVNAVLSVKYWEENFTIIINMLNVSICLVIETDIYFEVGIFFLLLKPNYESVKNKLFYIMVVQLYWFSGPDLRIL